MTLTLALIRHAKSAWDDPELSDHERPLNKRGRQAAPKIGAWLAERGVAPDMVLCSDAKRTQETWDQIVLNLASAPKPTLTRQLYLAHPKDMLNLLKFAQGQTVAMIAHNPGTAALAQMLVTKPPAHPGFGHYPTAATTIIRFDIDAWADLQPGTGQVVDFVVPRDLDG